MDVWVNTPKRPYEASGTSGMKAALNGVPSLSILDGWWIEGCIEGVTGWAIEDGADDAEEANSLYHKLENAVVPLYLESPEKWARLMRTTLAFNGSYFNTNRMVKQYTRNAYYPVHWSNPPKSRKKSSQTEAVELSDRKPGLGLLCGWLRCRSRGTRPVR